MNFNSRFFKQGFKKGNFKGFFNFKKEILNVNKSNSYYNLFIMNRIQKMNYLSILNSYKMTNSMFLLNNITLNSNGLTSQIAENETTGTRI